MTILKASSLPLVAVLNARSLYNKHGSFKIISEMWERKIQPLDKLLKMTAITILSYCRQSQSAMMGKQKRGQLLPDHRWKSLKNLSATHLGWGFKCGKHWPESFKLPQYSYTDRAKLDEVFPEKVVMVYYLDIKWMNPQLKNLLRKTKREFFKNLKRKNWKSWKRSS